MLSGDRYLNAAQNNQLRTIRVEAQRGSIVDRSGRTIVSNVPGTAVRIWTADLPRRAATRCSSAPKILRAAAAADEGARGEQGRPLTPILVKTAVHEDQVATLLEHRADFPGRDHEHLPPRLRAQSAAAQRSATSAGLARGAGAAREVQGRISGAARRSARPASRRVRRYLRGTPGPPSSASTRSTAARPVRDAAAGAAGNNIRLTLDVGLQRAAERALRDGIELAYQDDRFNANGGAIGARPARRRRSRWLEPDLQAVRLRRPVDRRSSSPDRRPRREGANYPGSTARSPASIRLAPPSSR